MKDRRASANRFRIGVVLAMAALLALGSFWLLDVLRRDMRQAAPASARTDPDYYVEQFNFVRVARTGQARYHISGARMAHSPQDDSYEITRPVVKSLSPTRPATTVVAERATGNADLSQVELFDNVKMDRPASATTRHLRMTSDHVLVLPNEDIMKTDRPVTLVSGTAVLKGTGMYANQATGEFRLSGDVRAVFPPKASK